jgi:hypothetical protein
VRALQAPGQRPISRAHGAWQRPAEAPQTPLAMLATGAASNGQEVAEMASSWTWEARAADEDRLARELESEGSRAEREAWQHRARAEQYRHRAEDPWAWQAERDRELRHERALLERAAQARWEASRHRMNADVYRHNADQARHAEWLLERESAVASSRW